MGDETFQVIADKDKATCRVEKGAFARWIVSYLVTVGWDTRT
jgi:hypothetical protein